jgi:hypothetical protein
MIHTSQLIIEDKQKSTEMGYGLRRGDLAVLRERCPCLVDLQEGNVRRDTSTEVEVPHVQIFFY